MPTLELDWLLRHPHTPNTRSHSLLWCTIPRDMTSLPVLFKGCIEYNQPSSSVYEDPAKHEVFQADSFPLLHSPKTNPLYTQRKTNHSHLWGLKENTTEHNRNDNLGNTQLRLSNSTPESFLALSWPKRLNNNPKQPKIRGETNNDLSAMWGEEYDLREG